MREFKKDILLVSLFLAAFFLFYIPLMISEKDDRKELTICLLVTLVIHTISYFLCSLFISGYLLTLIVIPINYVIFLIPVFILHTLSESDEYGLDKREIRDYKINKVLKKW